MSTAQQSGQVRTFFLEITEPWIPAGIQQCIDAGASEVIVLAYFLSAGRHLSTDLPAEAKIKQDPYPGINILIAPYPGSAPAIDNVLMSLL